MKPNNNLTALFQGIKTVVFFQFFLIGIAGLGQNSFIKTIEEKYEGRSISIKGLADNGFLIFAADSQKVYRFTWCGALLWASRFNIETQGSYNIPLEVISTKTGSLLFLFRRKVGSFFFPALVMMDGNGNIQFSKTYEDPFYTHYPYTITEDLKGNFVVFGTASYNIGAGKPYLRAMKVNGEGNEVWTNFYDHGWVWGGCIATSDTGFLFRNGIYTMKLNSMGNPEWSRKLNNTTNNYYYSPIEVEDGYIYSGAFSNSGKQFFIKLDKQGNGIFGNQHIFDFYGSPAPMIKIPNGNWMVAFNPNSGPIENPVLVEFDKDINVVASKAIKIEGLNAKFFLKNYEMATDGSILFTGLMQTKTALVPPKVFYGRAGAFFELACSDTFLITDSVRSYLVENEPFETIPYYTSTTNFNPQLGGIQSKSKTICGELPLKADLGKDTLICNFSPLLLKNLKPGDSDLYLWSTGQKGNEITIQNPGIYWLKTWNSCRQDTTNDTIQISNLAIPQLELVQKKEICNGNRILLKAQIPDADFLWSDGSKDSTFWVNEPGSYEVTITKEGCLFTAKAEITECEQLEMPSLFTPNSDQINDRVKPIFYHGIASSEMKLYNRWGQLIHETDNVLTKGWDGNGHNSGVYFWTLRYRTSTQKEKIRHGILTLVRN